MKHGDKKKDSFKEIGKEVIVFIRDKAVKPLRHERSQCMKDLEKKKEEKRRVIRKILNNDWHCF